MARPLSSPLNASGETPGYHGTEGETKAPQCKAKGDRLASNPMDTQTDLRCSLFNTSDAILFKMGLLWFIDMVIILRWRDSTTPPNHSFRPLPPSTGAGRPSDRKLPRTLGLQTWAPAVAEGT